METTKSASENETQFLELVQRRPIPTAELLSVIHDLMIQDSKKADESTVMLMQELINAFDFAGLFLLIKDRREQLTQQLNATGIRDALKKAALKDRLTTALIDASGFGDVPLEKAFENLDLLVSLKPETLILDQNWGVGKIRRMDDFYKRATIDFKAKSSHQMSFEAILENVQRAPHDHLLTRCYLDLESVKKIVEEQPGDVVKLALRSFGDMTIVRLEELLVNKHHLVAAAGWKSFWEHARRELKKDVLVVIPTKRTEALQLLAAEEEYGDTWFNDFSRMRDAVKLLALISDLENSDKFAGLDDIQRGMIEERLEFAAKSAYNTDPATYARVAVKIQAFGFLSPPADQMRAHLMDNSRYIKAAEGLAVKDVNAMLTFLLAGGDFVASCMIAEMAQMPYNLLNELLTLLKDSHEAEQKVFQLLSRPQAPATLVNWAFRSRETTAWTLPPLLNLLGHAISVIESKLSGEALRMQNQLKLHFDAHGKWLDKLFDKLDSVSQEVLFDRLQASTAWDPATHRTLIKQMLDRNPELTKLKKAVVAKQQAAIRQTSWHSLAERQLQYKHLIEVDMPKNRIDIAVARSYGDLRENFEYQAAKDLERQLQQRQSELQRELGQVKGTDFAGVAYDRVAAGTTVTLRMDDGSMRVYTVLGEWDRDEALNIISNMTRLATAIEGKRVGERAVIPSVSGTEETTIENIEPLSEEIRQWITTIPTEL